jgi:hypothetical protein
MDMTIGEIMQTAWFLGLYTAGVVLLVVLVPLEWQRRNK